MKIYRTHIIIFCAFVLATVVLTYPIAFRATQEAAGQGGDLFQIFANLHNTADYIRGLSFGEALLDTITNIRITPLSIGVYLQLLFGEPLGYNLFWLLSYVLSGFGMYLLTAHILRKFFSDAKEHRTLGMLQLFHPITIAAFLAGIFYSFNPAHVVWSMGFIGATHIEWIPLATYWIIRFFEHPRLREFIWVILTLALLTAGEAHFIAFYLIFLIPFSLWYLSRHRETLHSKHFWVYLGIVLLLGALCIALIYSSLFHIAASDNNYLNPGIEQVTRYSTDIFAFFTPSTLHRFFAQGTQFIRDTFTGNAAEYSTYLGFTALILFFLGSLSLKAHRQRRRVFLFWIISGVSFSVLALGPFLHYLGLVEPRIPLPYLAIYWLIPFIENIRTVDRIWVLALLNFSIGLGISAYGIMHFLRHKLRRVGVPLGGILIALCIVLEYISIPIPTSRLSYSPFYDRLKNETGDYQILEIPGSTNYLANTKTHYYASIHKKGLLSGLDTARKNPNKWAFQSSTPIISELLYTLPVGKTPPRDIITHDYQKLATPLLNYYNIQYIIFQREFIGDKENYLSLKDFTTLHNFITNNIRLDSIYKDDQIFAYPVVRLPKEEQQFIALVVGDGWKALQFDGNDTIRWLPEEATLGILNTHQQERSLNITLEAEADRNTLQWLEVFLNGKFQKRLLITDQSLVQEIALPTIPTGESTLTLKVMPYDDTTATGGILVHNVQYEPSDLPPQKTLPEAIEGKALIVSDRMRDFPDAPEKLFDIEDLVVRNKTQQSIATVWMPFINELMNPPHTDYGNVAEQHDIRENGYYKDVIANVLASKNITTLLVDNTLFQESRDALKRFFQDYIPGTTEVAGDAYDIYQLPKQSLNRSIPLTFGRGWDIVAGLSDTAKRRKLIQDGLLRLTPVNATEQLTLSFRASGCAEVQRIAITHDGVTVGTIDIQGEQYQTYTATLGAPLRASYDELILQRLDRFNNSVQQEAKAFAHCSLWLSDLSLYEAAE